MKTLILLLSLIPGMSFAATNYELVQEKIRSLAAEFPNRVQIFDLVLTEGGTVVQGMKILGTGEGINQLLVATHHGDEWGAPQVAMAFARELAAQPLPDRTVYVIPVIMPDSYNINSRNYLGVNPNRDYPGPCGSHDNDSSKKTFTLKATKALADFVDAQNIVTTIEVHNPWGTVHYPWSDTKGSYTLEHSIFETLLSRAYKGTYYTHSTVPDQFYTMRGAFTDYLFWQHGIWAYLVEVGPTKKPDEDTIAEEIAIHMPAFRKLLMESPTERSTKNQHDGCGPAGFVDSLIKMSFEE